MRFQNGKGTSFLLSLRNNMRFGCKIPLIYENVMYIFPSTCMTEQNVYHSDEKNKIK